MSKLQKSYINLKSKDADKIYLFKSGMFYLALADDCEKLSSVFGFKKTKLNEEIEKFVFPISRLGFYVGQLEKIKIQFKTADGVLLDETERTVIIDKAIKHILNI